MAAKSALSMATKCISTMSTPEFRFINSKDVSRVKPGTIMFLPPHELMPKGTYTDPSLLAGAFNHPVVIVSCPSPAEIKPTSHVEIAIVCISPPIQSSSLTQHTDDLLRRHLPKSSPPAQRVKIPHTCSRSTIFRPPPRCNSQQTLRERCIEVEKWEGDEEGFFVCEDYGDVWG